MAKKKKGTQIQEFENVQNALNKSEAFIEKHQKPLLLGFVGVVVAVLVVMGFKNYVLAPRAQEAQESIFKAEQYFAKDSFQLALNGDGENLGFLAIIDEYGMTSTAKLAKAYAGVCYKLMGDYETANSYLKDFSAGDKVLSPALKGAIGDCYLELEDKEKAISFFKEAVNSENEVIAPIYLRRIGLVYLSMGDAQKALSAFEEIKTKYAATQEGMEIDKFIQLAKTQQK